MLQPIQKENELICRGCGAVVGHVDDIPNTEQKPLVSYSINMMLLGSALNKSNPITRNPQQFYEEQILKELTYTAKQYDLPERIVLETFNELKRKKIKFRSKTEHIKQLIRILSKDENYIHFKKLKLIKAKYENYNI